MMPQYAEEQAFSSAKRKILPGKDTHTRPRQAGCNTSRSPYYLRWTRELPRPSGRVFLETDILPQDGPPLGTAAGGARTGRCFRDPVQNLYEPVTAEG